MSILENCEPKQVFNWFETVSSVPRGSGNEAGVSVLVGDFAGLIGLTSYRDEANNVFIRKPATPGHENAPAVLLQGHLDMVCEKLPECVHDFRRDGIKLILEGDNIRADGTTLGADDGIAVAMMMALLEEEDAVHGPIECLFTTEEETGLGGMKAFDKSMIKAKYMINLDSENDDTATVACAGGVRTDFTFSDIPTEPVNGAVTLTVSGLAGGHSGGDINLGRANAIKLAFSLLEGLDDVRIISVEGGSKDNAIPRDCTVVFSCADAMSAPSAIAENASCVTLSEADSGFRCDAKYGSGKFHAFVNKYSRALITLVSSLPYGPLAMSKEVDDFVETSSNVGIIKSGPDSVKITSSSRSSVSSSLDEIERSFDALAANAGAKCRHRDRYPGWEMTKDSELQKIYRDSYVSLFGSEPKIVGIHAGLECGLVKEEIPDLDIISIGPNALDIHTPRETLSVSSTQKIWRLLIELLRRLA